MQEWALWEVFVRSQSGLSHKHIGSIRAADAQMALSSAQDVHARRGNVVSIWVVRSNDISTSNPEERESLLAQAATKIYRHPTFYPIPPGIDHL